MVSRPEQVYDSEDVEKVSEDAFVEVIMAIIGLMAVIFSVIILRALKKKYGGR